MSAASTDTPPNRSIPLREVINEGTSALSAVGVASPLTDVHELIAFVLNTPRTRLALVTGITPEQLNRFRALVVERSRRVPLQHLTGRAGFRYLDLAVGPGVFVPRPETELLVEWGLAAVAGVSAPIVVDLCSGSGAIALSVARERPAADVYAVERSAAALEWLRRNAGPTESPNSEHDRATRFTIVAGDATSADTLSALDGSVDLVLCNPPYVPDGAQVGPEVAADPADAVYGGPTGLDVVRGVITRAAALLRPGGAFAVEHDDGQGASVPALLDRDGRFDRVEAHRDLAGRPRFASAYRLAH